MKFWRYPYRSFKGIVIAPKAWANKKWCFSRANRHILGLAPQGFFLTIYPRINDHTQPLLGALTHLYLANLSLNTF